MSAEIDSYISSLRRKLMILDGKERRDVLMEVRSHLSERVASGESPSKIIESFGSAASVAREYVRVYGYGWNFIAVLMIVGAVTSLMTVPAVYLQNPEDAAASWGPLILLLLDVLFIIGSSVKGGRKAGVSVGSAACVTRFVVIGFFAIGGTVTLGGAMEAIVFVATSLLLPLIGYLASYGRPSDKRAEI